MVMADKVRMSVPYGSPYLIARQSACRTTEIADQSTATKSHRKTTPTAPGCSRFSTSRLPNQRKIAAVITPMIRENSERRREPRPFRFGAAVFDFAALDMAREIGRASCREGV